MIELRRMAVDEWDAVAELIFRSTNEWYQRKLNATIFAGEPSVARVFPEVYEALDPGCCIVAEDTETGKLAGSCFYHPRETHYSLGIMNADAAYAGQGVARRILDEIIRLANAEDKPVRLVSSAMNLDSFSLYTRAGFVPRIAYQDMQLAVPEGGLDVFVEGGERVRDARAEDVAAMADLEAELVGIRREKDYRYFVENSAGIWHSSVIEDEAGEVAGFLNSVNHPGSNLLGPGVARDEDAAAALILAELNAHCGRAPVFLVPVACSGLVQKLYSWGARNCELHFTQVLGDFNDAKGVVMPTFMPETG